MTTIERLQTYLRQSAGQRYQAVVVPPFSLFFHPSDSFAHFNYAIPNEPPAGDLTASLAALRQTFAAQDRIPRFEFIAEFAPKLASTLEAGGFQLESQTMLMVCSPEQYRPVPTVPQLTITRLGEQAELADIKTVMAVQHQGFNGSQRKPVTDEEAANFQRQLAGTTYFLARLAGQPAAAGSLIAPLDGLAEIAGITTLPPYRRRGIATALTAAALQVAFDQGLEIALLTAADETAGRIYERAGFRPVATALAYVELPDT